MLEATLSRGASVACYASEEKSVISNRHRNETQARTHAPSFLRLTDGSSPRTPLEMNPLRFGIA
jgi:hypothetical protein